MKRRASRLFSRDQIMTLDQAWNAAGSLVADEYKMDFEDFRSWPVDIKSFAELSPEELATGVFAQLFRYMRPGPGLKGARPDYYRICLYDPAILQAVEEEPGLELAPLLTYVLTHELIHVARFARFMELFGADAERRQAEEEIVHSETFRLLSKVNIGGLKQVLNLYESHRLPVD